MEISNDGVYWLIGAIVAFSIAVGVLGFLERPEQEPEWWE